MDEGEQIQRTVLDIGEVGAGRGESIAFKGHAKGLDEIRSRIEDCHAAWCFRSGHVGCSFPRGAFAAGGPVPRRFNLVQRHPVCYWTLAQWPSRAAQRT